MICDFIMCLSVLLLVARCGLPEMRTRSKYYHVDDVPLVNTEILSFSNHDQTHLGKGSKKKAVNHPLLVDKGRGSLKVDKQWGGARGCRGWIKNSLI